MSAMNITLSETSAYNFQLSNSAGATMTAQSNPDMSGTNDSFRPMEILLGALAACSVIDLRLILEKQRQRIDTLEVSVDGERSDDEVPAYFTSITLHYRISGEVDENKAYKAVDLALYKYCSVQKHLAELTSIKYTLAIDSI